MTKMSASLGKALCGRHLFAKNYWRNVLNTCTEKNYMKVVTPHYYKDFKCIAGACTDTCCAGWDVDVDRESYRYYKTVKGDFGKRLKSVMVPSQDGECTFTLKEGGRCPFLNDDNLCDLYIELGEDKLCETCAEFPRFINDYGSIREIGIAPSCKTAGELMFSYQKELTFDVKEEPDITIRPNDIDAFTYMQLGQARAVAYEIMSDRSVSIYDRMALYLEYTRQIQKHLDNERDELIINVVKKFCKADYRDYLIEQLRQQHSERKEKKLIAGIRHFYDDFKGMEVINADWNVHVNRVRDVLDGLKDDQKLAELIDTYHRHCRECEHEYEQLAMYYIYRYMLGAVNDYDVLLKAKNAIIGIIAVDVIAAADYAAGLNVDFTMRVDIAHLYSRQFEHSYYNFEVYRDYFGRKRCYSYSFLMKALMSLY